MVSVQFASPFHEGFVVAENRGFWLPPFFVQPVTQARQHRRAEIGLRGFWIPRAAHRIQAEPRPALSIQGQRRHDTAGKVRPLSFALKAERPDRMSKRHPFQIIGNEQFFHSLPRAWKRFNVRKANPTNSHRSRPRGISSEQRRTIARPRRLHS